MFNFNAAIVSHQKASVLFKEYTVKLLSMGSFLVFFLKYFNKRMSTCHIHNGIAEKSEDLT